MTITIITIIIICRVWSRLLLCTETHRYGLNCWGVAPSVLYSVNISALITQYSEVEAQVAKQGLEDPKISWWCEIVHCAYFMCSTGYVLKCQNKRIVHCVNHEVEVEVAKQGRALAQCFTVGPRSQGGPSRLINLLISAQLEEQGALHRTQSRVKSQRRVDFSHCCELCPWCTLHNGQYMIWDGCNIHVQCTCHKQLGTQGPQG